MDYCKGRVTKLLVDYFENDFRRITYALEVLKHAEKKSWTAKRIVTMKFLLPPLCYTISAIGNSLHDPPRHPPSFVNRTPQRYYI